MNYPYGFCGMPCALCSRCNTDGKSRCPGCSFDGYYTDMCKVHHCCKDKQLPHCGMCDDFPCARLSKMSDFRDLDTGGVKLKTCSEIASDGFDKWYSGYALRAELLKEALANYNDGRMKRYLCELFIKNDISELREIMRRAALLDGTPKEKGKQFRHIAEDVLLNFKR